MTYTFDQLPQAVGELHNKLDQVISLLSRLSSSAPLKDELLDTEQAASFLKVRVQTVYDKVYKKEIPHFKKGKHLLFSKAELTEYIASGRVMTKEEQKRDATKLVPKVKRNSDKGGSR